MKHVREFKLEATTMFVILAFIALVIGGWFANIAKLIGMLGGDVSAMFIARIVGIFAAPLGVILGYF